MLKMPRTGLGRPKTAVLLGLLLSTGFGSAAHAAYNVTISAAATSGGSISSCVFTPTANNANLKVSDLTSSLATCNTKVTTGTSGTQAGDITVQSQVAWSANTLTLDAYHSITLNLIAGQATLKATSTAALTLTTNDGGTGGQLVFNGNITFQNTSEVLTINSTVFTLVADVSTLASDIHSTPGGSYALTNSYDASVDGTYTTSAIPYDFTGHFEGLGNSVYKITITDTTASDPAAFFKEVDTGGTVSDFALNGATVSGKAGTSGLVGGLVALNNGLLSNDSLAASGATAGAISISCGTGCSATDASWVGGIAGENQGTVSNSSSTPPASSSVPGSYVGGLVGLNNYVSSTKPAIISNSSSSASVTASSGGSDSDGGLVGANAGGTIENSSASGAVTCASTGGTVGGLLGLNNYDSSAQHKGVVQSSFATGAVGSSTACAETGGLVGSNAIGGIIGPRTAVAGISVVSYATGTVTGDQPGAIVGGLVGDNEGSIKWAYATGTVTNHGFSGGIAGENGGTIDQSFYETGTITDVSGYGTGGAYGGLVGNTFDGGVLTNSYSRSDVNTSSNGVGGAMGTYANSVASTNVASIYETGAVSASGTCVGGLIGESKPTHDNTLSNAYWDTTTSTQTNGVGPGTCSSMFGGDVVTGKTSTQLQVSPGTLAFDTTIWTYDSTGTINNGFPYLSGNPPP